MLNRAAITLRLREPALAWINSVDPDQPLTLADANGDSTLYLIPEEAGDVDEALAWVEANWQPLFDNELQSWCDDLAQWPADRTLALFHEWFAIESFSVIEDTVGGPIYDEDAEEAEDDLGMALLDEPLAPPGSIAAPVPIDAFTQALFGVLLRFEESDEDAELDEVMAGILGEILPGVPAWHAHFAARLRATIDLLEHPDLASYLHEEDDRLLIHPALLHAAAEMKVSRNGFFPRKLLVELADRLRATEYADWSWD